MLPKSNFLMFSRIVLKCYYCLGFPPTSSSPLTLKIEPPIVKITGTLFWVTVGARFVEGRRASVFKGFVLTLINSQVGKILGQD